LKKIIFLVLVSLLILNICSASLGKQDLLINLKEGTLNGKHVFDYTLSQITDLLGRPSAAEDEEKLEITKALIGSKLIYHDLGLSFNFEHSEINHDRTVKSVTIYFSRTWDEKFSEFYQPFAGKTVENVDQNWKKEKIMSEFSEFHTADVKTQSYYRIIVSRERHRVFFTCEPITTFLEEISIEKPFKLTI
jgi:hypothetical protein